MLESSYKRFVLSTDSIGVLLAAPLRDSNQMKFPSIPKKNLPEFLEGLYQRYNKREYVHPDPLEFLYRYSTIAEREIVGLIASSFAYGNVNQILKSVSKILKPMEKSPRVFVLENSWEDFFKIYKGFKHRWHTDEDLAGLLVGIQRVLKKFGSLENCFVAGKTQDFFVGEIIKGQKIRKNLLPLSANGSASKRLHMYLRWMVRHDEVDPGGWRRVSPASLLVPLDTHMFRMSQKLNLTRRKQANLKTVLEVTEGFLKIKPQDPVRYDFVLTRFGIQKKSFPNSF